MRTKTACSDVFAIAGMRVFFESHSPLHALVVRGMANTGVHMFTRDLCEATSLHPRTIGFVIRDLRASGLCAFDKLGRVILCG